MFLFTFSSFIIFTLFTDWGKYQGSKLLSSWKLKISMLTGGRENRDEK